MPRWLRSRWLGALVAATLMASLSAAHAQDEIAEEQRALIEAALPDAAPAAPEAPRKLLILTLNEGYGGHGSIPYAPCAVQRMGDKTGAFEAVVSHDRSMIDAETLDQFDAIYLNNTVGPLFDTPERREALTGFLANGGGLVGNHAVTVTSVDWPEFGEILGARGAWHRDPDEVVTIKLDDPDSPLNAAFAGDEITLTDEFFRFEAPYARDHVHVLVSIDVDKTDMHQGEDRPNVIREDNDYPISWTRRHGAGRVFYTSLGHNPHVFWHPKVLRHLLAGIQWAMGDLKADH